MSVAAGDSPTRERRIPLQGAHNCRDLGGLPAAGGMVVRPGRVLRCDSTAGFTDGDVHLLAGTLGLRTVLDLRTRQESTAHPSRLPDDVRHVNLPIRAAGPRPDVPDAAPSARDVVPAGADARPPITSVAASLGRTGDTGADDGPGSDDGPASPGSDEGPGPDEGPRSDEERAERLARGYQGYLEGSATTIVSALELLAEPGTTPALVHCTAGKDRTGVLVAMLLGVLGVPARHIVDDYAATDPNMPGILRRIRSSPLFRENGVADLPPWVFRARPATMRVFLEQLDAGCGGPVPWLLDRGLSPGTVESLRAQLLVRA